VKATQLDYSLIYSGFAPVFAFATSACPRCRKWGYGITAPIKSGGWRNALPHSAHTQKK